MLITSEDRFATRYTSAPADPEWDRLLHALNWQYHGHTDLKREAIEWFNALYARFLDEEDLSLKFVKIANDVTSVEIPAAVINGQIVISHNSRIFEVARPRSTLDPASSSPSDRIVPFWIHPLEDHRGFAFECMDLARHWTGSKEDLDRARSLSTHRVAQRRFERIKRRVPHPFNKGESALSHFDMRFGNGRGGNTMYGPHYDNQPYSEGPSSCQPIVIYTQDGKGPTFYIHGSKVTQQYSKPEIEISALPGSTSLHQAFNVNLEMSPGAMLYGVRHEGTHDPNGRVIQYMQGLIAASRPLDNSPTPWRFRPDVRG